MTCVRERRVYLWGGFIVGGSTLGGGSGSGLGGKRGVSTLGGKLGGTADVTLRGAWGSALPCSVGNGVATQVRLGGGVEVGLGVPVAEKLPTNCWVVLMVWAPKRAKDAASSGLVRASARQLAAPVAASEEDIAVMVLLWGENNTVFAVLSPRISVT